MSGFVKFCFVILDFKTCDVCEVEADVDVVDSSSERHPSNDPESEVSTDPSGVSSETREPSSHPVAKRGGVCWVQVGRGLRTIGDTYHNQIVSENCYCSM